MIKKVINSIIKSKVYKDAYRAGYLDGLNDAAKLLNQFYANKVEELYARNRENQSNKG